jgi:hypothetical protein
MNLDELGCGRCKINKVNYDSSKSDYIDSMTVSLTWWCIFYHFFVSYVSAVLYLTYPLVQEATLVSTASSDKKYKSFIPEQTKNGNNFKHCNKIQ